MNEEMLDNLLVHQKNYILTLINDGRLAEAQVALQTVAELWSCCNYAYKEREIQARIEAIRNECVDQVKYQRRNDAY